jgi:fluoride exporter
MLVSPQDDDGAGTAGGQTTLFAGPPPRQPRLALPPLRSVAAVAAGGMIGAVLRVGFTLLLPNGAGRFPWTTFAENVGGAFLLGFVLVLLLERLRPRRQVHPFLCTGILGSFTTFSNFSAEWVALAGDGDLRLALAYPLASMIAGLAAAMLGIAVARRWPPFVQRKDPS